MPANMTKLSQNELDELLREMPEWALEDTQFPTDTKLVRYWTFADFAAAMVFVNRIAELAEQHGHHPDIDIRYNRVKLGLVSHDADGITSRDVAMARLICGIAPC